MRPVPPIARQLQTLTIAKYTATTPEDKARIEDEITSLLRQGFASIDEPADYKRASAGDGE